MVRNPAFALLVGAGALLVVASPLFAVFHLGEQMKLVADLGLGTALLVGLLIGVLGASWAISEELENLTVYAILSKPVSRAAYLVGKYLGVLSASAIGAAIPTLALLLTLRGLAPDRALLFYSGGASLVLVALGTLVFWRLGVPVFKGTVVSLAIAFAALTVGLDGDGVLAAFGRSVGGWSWVLLPAFVGIVCQVAVLSAVSVALSIRLGLAVSLPATLALFVVGQISPDPERIGVVGRIASAILPDLNALQFSDAVTESLSSGAADLGTGIGPGIVIGSVVVSLVYVTGALLVAGALFTDRDVR
jgi:ABC-type transport system involved in multi-copper enzyme maturation permease subunit